MTRRPLPDIILRPWKELLGPWSRERIYTFPLEPYDKTPGRDSEFLRRLEHALTKVVLRGGVTAQQRDRIRIEQLLRGAVESDLMLVQFGYVNGKRLPPSFLQLLPEIREEEDQQSMRQGPSSVVS